MRQLELKSLVLRRGGADPERQAKNGQAAKLHPPHRGHRILPLFFWSTIRKARRATSAAIMPAAKSSCISNFRIYSKSCFMYSGAAAAFSSKRAGGADFLLAMTNRQRGGTNARSDFRAVGAVRI